MKRLSYIFVIFIVLLSSCATFKSIKCGAPSTDTYLNFTVDTVATSDTIKQVLISSVKHDRYFEDSKFSGGRFNNETIGEFFSRVRGNGALLIVRNDTINEAYSFGWNNIITRVEGKDIVSPRFFAIGLYGQVLFCDPTQNLIFVTLGEKKGSEYHLLFDDFCNLISQ